MRPRWTLLIILMNCSSDDSVYSIKAVQWRFWLKCTINIRNHPLLKQPRWHSRIGHTFTELEQSYWEGTCNWLTGTSRSFLFLSGVLSVTAICGAEPWRPMIPGCWGNKPHLAQNSSHHLCIYRILHHLLSSTWSLSLGNETRRSSGNCLCLLSDLWETSSWTEPVKSRVQTINNQFTKGPIHADSVCVFYPNL